VNLGSPVGAGCRACHARDPTAATGSRPGRLEEARRPLTRGADHPRLGADLRRQPRDHHPRRHRRSPPTRRRTRSTPRLQHEPRGFMTDTECNEHPGWF